MAFTDEHSSEASANAIWVLVSGKRYAGKDTVADLLAEHMRDAGRCIVRTSFALGVKVDAAIAYGLDAERLINDSAYKEQHRKILIDHGAAMRAADPDYWVKRAWEAAAASIGMQNGATCQQRPVVIVSDWRFPNEADWIALRTAIIRVRVSADNWTRAQRGWAYNEVVDTDVSEVSLDGAAMDVRVDNVAGIDAMLVEPIIAEIKRY